MLNKLEKKFGKFAIKNLSYYIMIIYVLGSIIGLTVPNIYYQYLALDFDAIKIGQVWRLITFIFYPQVTSLDLFEVLMGILCIFLYYYIGTILENTWGSFRFNVYYLSGILLNILGMLVIYLVTGQSISFGMTYIQNAMFLAFATLAPNMCIHLFFIIPIKIKWIGIFYGVILFFQIIANLLTLTPAGIACAVAIIVSVLNFIVYFLSQKLSKPKYKNNMKIIPKTTQKEPKNITKCAICGKTKKDNPELEFRYCSKCTTDLQYCEEHIFNHTHR